MKQFFSTKDIGSLSETVHTALSLKEDPLQYSTQGKHKTLGLIFLNPSLRTRLSTQKAARNLGMDVMVLNLGSEGWAIETCDGVVMDGSSAEHIKEAAAVIGSYCDIIGVRSFPGLISKDQDYSEELLLKFAKYCNKPILSLESATGHPLQALTDLITIFEKSSFKYDSDLNSYKPLGKKIKVVLSWAPHIKALPQAVPNSFSEIMSRAHAEGLIEFVITHPKGYELNEAFTGSSKVMYDQDEALKEADFIYVKNWSSYQDYGQILSKDSNWMLNLEKLKATNQAKVMHCLPVRRDLVLASEVLDSTSSIVIEQASNRVWAAQAVLLEMLKNQ